MKIGEKKILVIIAALIFFSSCYKKKEIRVIGFAYKGDNIILRSGQINYLNIIVNERENKTNICSFNQKVKLSGEKMETKLIVIIDSGYTKLLDTVVIIPKNYKEPFISFIYPSIETQYGRKIFVADEADSSFLKD